MENIPCKRSVKEEFIELKPKKRISLSRSKTRQKKEENDSCQQHRLKEIKDLKTLSTMNTKHEEQKEPLHCKESQVKHDIPFEECIKVEDNIIFERVPGHFSPKQEYNENKPLEHILCQEKNILYGETKEKRSSQIKQEIEEDYNCPICDISLTYITCTEFRQKHVDDCISSAQYVEEVSDGCIICGIELSHFDLQQRQIHINRCLDGPMSTTFNDRAMDDFVTPNIIFKHKQRLPKPTREEDKNDELYQTTLAMSKSLQNKDKKIKIEMNEANIWSNDESHREANARLYQLCKTNELDMAKQNERDSTFGYLNPSSVCTLTTTLLPNHPVPVNLWELANLQDVDPMIFTCSFLRKIKD